VRAHVLARAVHGAGGTVVSPLPHFLWSDRARSHLEQKREALRKLEADVLFLFPDLSSAGMEAWVRGGPHRDAVARLF